MWHIGITHLVKPPFDPEREAFGDEVSITLFDTNNEREFDPALLRELDAFLVWTPEISAHTVQHLTRCQIVVRYGVGYDKIDRAALSKAGIQFSNNPEYGPEDVADTAMSMILSLQRRIFQHDQVSRTYKTSWQENHLTPVFRSCANTVGVIGVGRIGSSVVNRLKPFGHQILGYDPYVSQGHSQSIGYERVHTLDELFSRSSIITLHCPLTNETRGMINAKRIAQLPQGAILVNTARGALVDNLTTIELGLRDGRLSATGLDVLPHEPPRPHALLTAWRNYEPWLAGRLIINPHNAFYSDQAMTKIRLNAAETARLYLNEGIHRNSV